jgi:opacity protein-like surface antigen
VSFGSASAEPSDDAKSGGAVLVGGKLGGIVPFGGLSPFVTVGLEAGYIFPWMNRSFAAALYVDYTAPKADGSKQDPRLGDAGGSYEWKLTEQELTFMPVVMYRLTSLGTVTPYAGIGPRIYLLKSTVQGSAMGATIDETTEQSTKVGFGIPVGVEFELGPGALLAELLFQYGGLDHEITGDTNTGALSLSVGYRGIL